MKLFKISCNLVIVLAVSTLMFVVDPPVYGIKVHQTCHLRIPIFWAKGLSISRRGTKKPRTTMRSKTDITYSNAYVIVKGLILKFSVNPGNIYFDRLERIKVVSFADRVEIYDYISWKDKELLGVLYFNEEGKLLANKDTGEIYKKNGKEISPGDTVVIGDLISIFNARIVQVNERLRSQTGEKTKIIASISIKAHRFVFRVNLSFWGDEIKKGNVAVIEYGNKADIVLLDTKRKIKRKLGTLIFDKENRLIDATDESGYSHLKALAKQDKKIEFSKVDNISVWDIIPFLGIQQIEIKEFRAYGTANSVLFFLSTLRNNSLYPALKAGRVFYIGYRKGYGNKLEIIKWDSKKAWEESEILVTIDFDKKGNLLGENDEVIASKGGFVYLHKHFGILSRRVLTNFYTSIRSIQVYFHLKEGDLYYDDFKNGNVVLYYKGNDALILRIDPLHKTPDEVLAILYFNDKGELLDGKSGTPLEEQRLNSEVIKRLIPRLASSVMLFPEPRTIEKSLCISIDGIRYYFDKMYKDYKVEKLPFSEGYGGLWTPDGELYRVFVLSTPKNKSNYVKVRELIKPEEVGIFEEEEDSYVEVGKFLQQYNILISDIEEDKIFGLIEFHRFYGIDGLSLLFEQAGAAIIGVLPQLVNPEIVHQMCLRSDNGIAPVGISLSKMCEDYSNNMDIANRAIIGEDNEIMQRLWNGIMAGLSEANERILGASYEGKGELFAKDISQSQYELRLIAEALLCLHEQSYFGLSPWKDRGYRFNIRIADEDYIVIVRFDTVDKSQGVRINIFSSKASSLTRDEELASLRLDYDEFGLGLDIEAPRLGIIYRVLGRHHHFIRHIPQSLQAEWSNILEILERRWFEKKLKSDSGGQKKEEAVESIKAHSNEL